MSLQVILVAYPKALEGTGLLVSKMLFMHQTQAKIYIHCNEASAIIERYTGSRYGIKI